MSAPRIGLALGGGGARGLAHIAMLEVFDELGIKPVLIAGTSMGAIIGAAYASGIEARVIRAHAEKVLGNRAEFARLLFERREGSGFFDLFNVKLFGPVFVNGERLAEVVFPQGVAERVEDTAIPLKVIATDFYDRREMVIESGPLRAAVAASMAIPALISAPRIGGRVIIDGGMTNPVPFDHVRAGTDISVAIDVIGGPTPRDRRGPSNMELALGASQVMMRRIAQLKREMDAPDIYIEPLLDRFRVLELFRAREILDAASEAKDDLKRQLEARLARV